MALPGETLVVIQVRASPSASELNFTSGASPELLFSTTKCRPCKNDWVMSDEFPSITMKA